MSMNSNHASYLGEWNSNLKLIWKQIKYEDHNYIYYNYGRIQEV